MQGLAHALLGHTEEALEHADKSLRLRPIEEDAFQGNEPLWYYVRTLAQLGMIEEAVEKLEFLLATDSAVTIPWIRNDRFLDPVAEDPRFAVLEEKYGSTGERPER